MGPSPPAPGPWHGSCLDRGVIFLLGLGLLVGSALAESFPDAGPVRPAGTPTRITCSIQRGDTLIGFDRDRAGQPLAPDASRARAGELLQETLGPGYQGSTSWKVVELLTDPEYRARIQDFADMGKGLEASFVLVPRDDEAPIWPWCDARYAPAPGSTAARPVYQYVGTVTLGGKGLEPLVGQGLAGMILHEAGHLPDGASRAGNGYGPDDAHMHDEVITPAAAFAEGFADYLGLKLPARYATDTPFTEFMAGGRLDPSRLASLQLEGTSPGSYTPLPQPSAAEYLANEVAVAGILGDLEAAAGREPVTAAFQATNDSRARTLADFLGAFAGGDPARAGLVDEVVLRWTQGRADQATLDALRAGRLPAGMDPNSIPGAGPALLAYRGPAGGAELAAAGLGALARGE